ncbi:MAG: hypothetical protein FIA96_13535 [Betaproteobacteria bacterium]|nr:hypothetical protein [Betaproteobacteria bacterium]
MPRRRRRRTRRRQSRRPSIRRGHGPRRGPAVAEPRLRWRRRATPVLRQTPAGSVPRRGGSRVRSRLEGWERGCQT